MKTSTPTSRVIRTATDQITVELDPTLPPDRVELRNAEGVVLSVVRIATIETDTALERYVLTMLKRGGATPYAAPLDLTVTPPVDPGAGAPALDVITDLRERIEAAVSTFIVSPAQANLDAVLDEALRDAVAVGSGFLRIAYRMPAIDRAAAALSGGELRGEWVVTKLDPTTVEIRGKIT